jgi:hypothetical protein
MPKGLTKRTIVAEDRQTDMGADQFSCKAADKSEFDFVMLLSVISLFHSFILIFAMIY